MQKVILITGATDGIGLATAKKLVEQGHRILIHGRNKEKLDRVEKELIELSEDAQVEPYLADLSSLSDAEALAKSVVEKHSKLDVLINNAGVLKTPQPTTQDGLDVRFVVNTFSPYLLTKKLLPVLGTEGRVVNLSSAAQSPVNQDAMLGKVKIVDDLNVYAQSKLAITMWSHALANTLKDNGPVFIALNPGSLLATKMVKEGFGMAGHDIGIGADVLVRAALSDEFADASGQYFDNDAGGFASPHHDADNLEKSTALVQIIEKILSEKVQSR